MALFAKINFRAARGRASGQHGTAVLVCLSMGNFGSSRRGVTEVPPGGVVCRLEVDLSISIDRYRLSIL